MKCVFLLLPYPCKRGPTTEHQPTPHFGLNFHVYSNMRPCVAALEIRSSNGRFMRTELQTRALKSTKSSACCRALASCISMQRQDNAILASSSTLHPRFYVAAEDTATIILSLQTGNEANVISIVQGSMTHSSNNPGVLYQTPHCSTDTKSASLTVASLGTASFFKTP